MKQFILTLSISLICVNSIFSQFAGTISVPDTLYYQNRHDFQFQLTGNTAPCDNNYVWEVLRPGSVSWSSMNYGFPYVAFGWAYNGTPGVFKVRCGIKPSSSAPLFYTPIVTIRLFPAFNPGKIIGDTMACLEMPFLDSLYYSIPPNGGNNKPTYQWQMSTNTVLWSDISGKKSKSCNPEITLNSKTYFRCLVSAGAQAISTNTITIYLYDTVKADFTVNHYELKSGEANKFINMSKNALSYKWLLDEGFESAEESPSKYYYSPGWYSISLTATSKDGCTSTITKSKAFQVISSATLNEKANEIFEVYPQPAHDILTINFSGSLMGNMTLYSLSGVKLKEYTLDNYSKSIDFSDVKEGTYILKITSQKGMEYSKVITKE